MPKQAVPTIKQEPLNIMEIDHIGYAVLDFDKAIEEFKLIWDSIGEVVEDTDRNVKICFCKKDNYIFEVISPLDTKLSSPIDTILKKNRSTPYHICYKTPDIKREIAKLTQNNRYILLIEPQIAKACNNARVAFLYSQAIGLIELVEKK